MDIRLKLRESLLNEIFDDKGLPFNLVEEYIGTYAYLQYEFDVPNKDGDYTISVECSSMPKEDNTTLKHICDDLNIQIYPNGIYLSVNFKLKNADDGESYSTINKGDVLKIMSTVKTIVLTSIRMLEKKGLKLMMIYSMPVANIGKTPQSTDTREKMYNYLYNKIKKPSFELFKFNSYSGMYNTKKLRKSKPLKPLIQTKPTVLTQLEVIERINDFLTTTNDDGVFMVPKFYNGNNKTTEIHFTDFDDYPNKFYFDYFLDIKQNGDDMLFTRFAHPKDQRTLDFVLQHIDEFNNVIR